MSNDRKTYLTLMPKEGKGKTHKRKLKMIAKRNEPRATNLSVVFKNDDC